MQADGFSRSKYHGLLISYITLGLSLKVYKIPVKIILSVYFLKPTVALYCLRNLLHNWLSRMS